MTSRFAQGTLEAVTAAALVTFIVLGSLFLWIGVPVLGLWLAGELTTRAQTFLFIALGGIPLAMIGFGWVLYRVNGVYERLRGSVPEPGSRPAWLGSLSDERARFRRRRAPRRLIDVAMTVSAWTALVILVVWFFFFAEMKLVTWE